MRFSLLVGNNVTTLEVSNCVDDLTEAVETIKGHERRVFFGFVFQITRRKKDKK